MQASAKRGTYEHAVVQIVSATLCISHHVLSCDQVWSLHDGDGSCHGEHEQVTNTQGEGSLHSLVHRRIRDIEHGNMHLIEYGVIAS